MSFGSDFDRHARSTVITHAIAGGFLGALPGALVAFFYDIPSDPNRYVPTAALAVGCVLGTLVSALASSTALIIAQLRKRMRSSSSSAEFVVMPPHTPKAAAPQSAPVSDSAAHPAMS